MGEGEDYIHKEGSPSFLLMNTDVIGGGAVV